MARQAKPISKYITMVQSTIKLLDLRSIPSSVVVLFPSTFALSSPEQIIPAVRQRNTCPAMNQMRPPTKLAQVKNPVANLSIKLLWRQIAREAVKKDRLVIMRRKKPK